VNRNIIGAVVGVQPFGGEGLSGTGPKAGGPLTLSRLVSGNRPLPAATGTGAASLQARGALNGIESEAAKLKAQASESLTVLADWTPSADVQGWARELAGEPPVGRLSALPGPTGEVDVHALLPRGRVLCIAPDAVRLAAQLVAAFACGNRALVPDTPEARAALETLPAALAKRIDWVAGAGTADTDAVLFAGDADRLGTLLQQFATRTGALVGCHVPDAAGRYAVERLLVERVVSINTSAAGGNASLMMVG